MAVATDRRMTLQEYLTYDDGTTTRYELVDGVLVAMGAESPVNSWVAGFLFGVFLELLGYKRIGTKHLIQVRSSHVSARDPDLIIHTDESATALGDGRKEACLKLNDPNPLIAIEVVSPGSPSTDNYQRDYVQKPVEYADRGIPEYWIVDPDRLWVMVGTLKDDVYEFATFKDDDTIASPTFPELKLTAIAVLSAGR